MSDEKTEEKVEKVEKKPRVRQCVWVDDAHFNLESWVAGKLRATIEIYNIEGVGSTTATFREVTEDEIAAVDAMVAAARVKFWSDPGLFRYRNIGACAMSIVAIDGKPWPASKSPLSVVEQVELFRKGRTQVQMDMFLKAYGDFSAELMEKMGVVDPKLFASPSGASAES